MPITVRPSRCAPVAASCLSAYNVIQAPKSVDLTPLWRSDLGQAKPDGTFQALTDALTQATMGILDFRAVRGLDLMPHLPDFFADGLHPSDAGFLFFALNLLKSLRGPVGSVRG